jgi:hypothetical protein
MRTAWNRLDGSLKTPLIRVSSSDSTVKKTVAAIANCLKKRVVEVAFVVTTIFAVLYCLISYPFRLHQERMNEKPSIESDLARIKPQEKDALHQQLETYFQKHEDHFGKLTSEEKADITLRVASQCARSQDVFSPIARQFVDQLLETANKEGRKIVFMARDGIVFYEIAKELMKQPENVEKYPNLANKDAIVLGYFSRALIDHADSSDENKAIFKRYISENLGIQPKEKCIFVDIGFAGSMVAPIRGMLPENEIDFEFLIATSNRAKGFLGTMDQPLENFTSEKHNLGTRWMEETHHGTLASGKKLFVDLDGKVQVKLDNIKGIPSPKHAWKFRTEEKFSLPYMIRKFCKKTVVQTAAELPLQNEEALVKAKKAFSELVWKLQYGYLPMLIGWDK